MRQRQWTLRARTVTLCTDICKQFCWVSWPNKQSRSYRPCKHLSLSETLQKGAFMVQSAYWIQKSPTAVAVLTIKWNIESITGPVIKDCLFANLCWQRRRTCQSFRLCFLKFPLHFFNIVQKIRFGNDNVMQIAFFLFFNRSEKRFYDLISSCFSGFPWISSVLLIII